MNDDDFLASSNFERYLFYLFGEKPEVVRALMQAFESKGDAAKEVAFDVAQASPGMLTVPADVLRNAQGDFLAAKALSGEAIGVITDFHEAHQ